MRRLGSRTALVSAVALAAATVVGLGLVESRLRAITLDYPLEGSLFPTDFVATTFLWRIQAAP